MRSRLLVLAAILSLGPTATMASGTGERSKRPAGASDMARLPAGTYRPLYVRGGESRRVLAFSLDRHAVTRAEFLAFVRHDPRWRRDRIAPTLAEPSYLASWPASLDAGRVEELNRPVTGVSWFAADAYCAAQGKRLPTLDEWEYAAAASETRRDGSADREHRARLLAVYAARPSTQFPAVMSGAANVYGVRGLHGSVWEWTRDAGPAATTDHDHAAHARSGAATGACASAALGAGDPSDYPAFLRSAVRAGLTPRTTLGALGFRCAA
jgi:formylglycine-generating enzyme required for sulfatase activity